MIVSDTYQFAFVHIPKCAGTFVRKYLRAFDERDGMFTGRVDHHPVLGNLDYVHIPLFILKKHFPEEFNAILNYWSFAVVRDPFARFASSISQRLKMYSDTSIQQRSISEIREYINESINYLSSQPNRGHLLPPGYIHFQPQIDYLELENKQIVDTIYSVDGIDTLLADVGRRVGRSLVDEDHNQCGPRANQSVVFRSEALRKLFVTALPAMHLVGRVLPNKVKQIVRERLYVPRDQRLNELFSTVYVQDFVRDYYASDLAVFNRVRAAERGEAS